MNPITPETCFVPKTHEGRGRRTAVAPGATAARYLHYGRITLAAGDAPIEFNSNDHEIGLICLKGNATVTAKEEIELYVLGKDDFQAVIESSATFKEQLTKTLFERQ